MRIHLGHLATALKTNVANLITIPLSSLTPHLFHSKSKLSRISVAKSYNIIIVIGAPLWKKPFGTRPPQPSPKVNHVSFASYFATAAKARPALSPDVILFVPDFFRRRRDFPLLDEKLLEETSSSLNHRLRISSHLFFFKTPNFA